MRYLSLLLLLLLAGCSSRQVSHENQLTTVQLIDRNGFRETISSPDRLRFLAETDFSAPQPYEKVMRVYRRTLQGRTPSKVTTYHSNGELWKYLEVVNGRASGSYREWHENSVLRIEATVIEGLGDLGEEAQLSWIFDGSSRAFDRWGRLLAEIYYVKGALQGNALYYHKNGEISKMIPYENDLIDGELLYYDTQGLVIGKTPYIEGRRDGMATYKGDGMQPAYLELYKRDLIVEATYHDFSGKIISRIEKGEGEQAIFEEGRLQSLREYQRGRPNGSIQLFNERGQLRALYHMKDQMKVGEEWIYYSSLGEEEQQAKLYLQWIDDAVQGTTRSWYRNGVLESEREFAHNKKQGISSCWYSDGSLMMVEEYENDELIRGTYMKRGDPIPVSSIEDGEGSATFYDGDGFFIKRVSYKKGRPADGE
ncbi:MAG: hypothetical protein K1060chlam2_00782 [Chlamydiae bacterium]|nr:hypothetical protein [Chlamydiota bacterium]